jgi:hypothetical protein
MSFNFLIYEQISCKVVYASNVRAKNLARCEDLNNLNSCIKI